MNELERALVADSAAASPTQVLDGLSSELAQRTLAGSPHTIYQELWHISFWQQITLDWIAGTETPVPEHASLGFATREQTDAEPWDALRQRFFNTLAVAAEATRDEASLDRPVRCPSVPGQPVRIMSVRDQLLSLAAHNAYHFGRIVLLRQLAGAWPPASGGYSW